MNDVLRLRICHQHIVLPAIPGVSISCLMKNKPSLLHEIGDLPPCGWCAEENGLASHNACLTSGSMNPMNLPVQTENLHCQMNAFEILLLTGKTRWAESPAAFTCVSGLDCAAIIRKPHLMFRTPRLSEAFRYWHQVHSRAFHQRLQNGRLDAVSLPAASNSFTCLSHASRVTGGCSRTIRARRARSASRMASICAVS